MKETEGDLDGALGLLHAAEPLYIRTPLPDVRPIAALKARIWVAQGNLNAALDWQHAQGLTVDDELSYLREFEHITVARLLIAQHTRAVVDGSIYKALRLLKRLLHAAETGGRIGSVIEILVLQALAYEAQDNVAPAFMSLQRALTLAEPEGYVRIFVDEGPPMVRLLSAPAAHGQHSVYIRKILAAFEPEKQPRVDVSHVPFAPSDHSLIEPLSARELVILQLISQGLSNREISERLFLAMSTIKGHIRSIVDKLQVHRRTEAVAHARALGLL